MKDNMPEKLTKETIQEAKKFLKELNRGLQRGYIGDSEENRSSQKLISSLLEIIDDQRYKMVKIGSEK